MDIPAAMHQMSQQEKSRIGVWWILANVIGLLAGYWVGSQICDSLFMSQCPPAPRHGSVDCYIWNPISWMVVIGAVVGTFVGVAEWFILRKYITCCKWWVTANILGWAIGFGVLVILREVLRQTIGNLDIQAMYGAAAGLVIGVAQWFVLRRLVHKAGWWIAAMVLTGFLTFRFNFPGAIFVSFWQLVLSGSVTGVISTMVLIRLFEFPITRPELVT